MRRRIPQGPNSASTDISLRNPNVQTKIALKEANQMKKSIKISHMVITISILFAIGNIPNSMVFVFQQYVDNNGIFYRTFSATANLFLFAVQGSDIWVYYNFNHHYRKEFMNLFKF
jgi:hypothetical protein